MAAGLSYTLWTMTQLSRNRARRAKYSLLLRDPEANAEAFAERLGHKEPVVGNVIEVWAHQSLESMVSFPELGVPPSLFRFAPPEPRDFAPVLARCGGMTSFDARNQHKYGISELPVGTMDDENFTVKFLETDWNTWVSVRTAIEKDLDLRHDLCHLDPVRSRIPQSMSLQFIVRFNSGDIFALKRGPLGSHPGKWSFSAEEQLHENDFKRPSDEVPEHLFRRAFVEEVLGRREFDSALLDRIWREDCSTLVRSYRVWGFFFEECTGILQMFGVYQLKISPKDLRDIHKAAGSLGTTDNEGVIYTISESDIESLLVDGRCLAHRLHGDPERRPVTTLGLHPTSRYRLWRLHAALHRSPETLISLNIR